MVTLERKALAQLEDWRTTSVHKVLLVDGARQVGKTFLIRRFGSLHYEHVAEVNLLEIEGAAKAFSSATSSDNLFTRLSLYVDAELVPHKTLIFIDEVQEAPEMITAAKFLVDNYGNQFDFVFSGSLLGVELKGIKSWPVGYMRTITMYPLDFEEWCWANGLDSDILSLTKTQIGHCEQVDPFIHDRLMQLLHYYLAVGGMPEAVQEYVSTKNLQRVRSIQKDIVEYYRYDITRYCSQQDVLFVRRVYDLLPSQLNQQNKRFIVSKVGKHVRVEKNENRFVWLVDAGVVIPTYNVSEPRYPLMLSGDSTLFKLFMSDVGLLAYESGMDTVKGLIGGECVNYGAIYENYVAQELTVCGKRVWYFRSKKHGELDFIVDWPDGTALPIEVKSGKNYHRHRAINNVLSVAEWGIKQGVVLHDGNVLVGKPITYLPIYAAGWLDVYMNKG